MSQPEDSSGSAFGEPAVCGVLERLVESRRTVASIPRRVFTRLPAAERCQLCASPFDGPAAPIVRVMGKARWAKNAKFCASCLNQMSRHRGGAGVETALLFADVRGSTSLAESMSPTAFRALIDDFFAIASHTVVEHDGVVDKFVGDEIVSLFVPAWAGNPPVVNALAAARSLMRHLHARKGPAYTVGAGVHTAIADVGAIGTGSHVDMTAMGDPVNVAARLASVAGGGETLVSAEAASRAALDTTGLEPRHLDLKGKSTATTVYVIGTFICGAWQSH